MSILEQIWSNWILVSFLTPAVWALVNLIDVYFVKGIYENEYDGATISCLFQVVPLVSIFWMGFPVVEKRIALLAILGGLAFAVSMFFYFKALFVSNDASLVETFLNAVSIVVPILAFFLIGEILNLFQYIGIVIVFVGAITLVFDREIRKRKILKVGAMMLIAVLSLSVSMIIERDVYAHASFWDGFLYFSFGVFLAGVIFYFLRRSKGNGSLSVLTKRYLSWFIVAELLALAGVLTSQRAIDISPAVSLVAVIESFIPVFILIFSVLISACAILIMPTKSAEAIETIRQEQLIGMRIKLIAIGIMAIGIYLINK